MNLDTGVSPAFLPRTPSEILSRVYTDLQIFSSATGSGFTLTLKDGTEQDPQHGLLAISTFLAINMS